MNAQELPKIEVIGKLDIRGMDIIRRVYSQEGISPTLNTCGGGYREVKILDLSKYRVRKLTPTEYGRLQAFPMESWEQVVSDSQAYKQFGNAVTVNVVQAIAEQIKACLSTEKPTEMLARADNPENDTEAEIPTEKNPLAMFSNAELLEELMRRQACG